MRSSSASDTSPVSSAPPPSPSSPSSSPSAPSSPSSSPCGSPSAAALPLSVSVSLSISSTAESSSVTSLAVTSLAASSLMSSGSIVASPARVVLGGFQGPFPPVVGPQAALKCSYRSDRVTRDWPVALRVRAQHIETRKGPDGPHSGTFVSARSMARQKDATRAFSAGPRAESSGLTAPHSVSAGASPSSAACGNHCLGEFQAPFPPAVSHRLLLSALAAAIE